MMIETRNLMHDMQQQQQYVNLASMKMATMEGQIDKQDNN